MAGDPGFLQALDDLRALHLSKGHDYADATDPLRNYVQSALDGGIEPWRAAWIRLSEKYHRFVNLTRKGDAPNHESLDDTLMDLAALALIARSLRARQKVGICVQVSTIPHEPNSGTILPSSGMTACECSGCQMYHAAICEACSAQGDGDYGG